MQDPRHDQSDRQCAFTISRGKAETSRGQCPSGKERWICGSSCTGRLTLSSAFASSMRSACASAAISSHCEGAASRAF
eukprot:2626608-Pleurochrysis_carterae.AAC.1